MDYNRYNSKLATPALFFIAIFVVAFAGGMLTTYYGVPPPPTEYIDREIYVEVPVEVPVLVNYLENITLTTRIAEDFSIDMYNNITYSGNTYTNIENGNPIPLETYTLQYEILYLQKFVIQQNENIFIHDICVPNVMCIGSGTFNMTIWNTTIDGSNVIPQDAVYSEITSSLSLFNVDLSNITTSYSAYYLSIELLSGSFDLNVNNQPMQEYPAYKNITNVPPFTFASLESFVNATIDPINIPVLYTYDIIIDGDYVLTTDTDPYLIILKYGYNFLNASTEDGVGVYDASKISICNNSLFEYQFGESQEMPPSVPIPFEITDVIYTNNSIEVFKTLDFMFMSMEKAQIDDNPMLMSVGYYQNVTYYIIDGTMTNKSVILETDSNYVIELSKLSYYMTDKNGYEEYHAIMDVLINDALYQFVVYMSSNK